MISFAEVNWLAVIVGVIGSNVLGFLWYGPLFGETWMRMIGKTRDEIEASSSMYIVAIVGAAIAMTVLAVFVNAIGAASFVDGLIAGAVAWIGLGATATFLYTTFEGPPTNVWFLNAVYNLIVWTVMGGVFAVWTA